MRVYGTSPLYNYIELVFRSKRLFIGSMIIATVATTFFYFYKVNNYSARTLVLLTGTQAPNPEDKEQKGTIQYKISILNLELRDPAFIKSALKAEGLDQRMNGEQFDTFAKEVREKISFAVTDNVLEIAITWPDARAANIVNAIYGEYSRKVISEETIVSQTNTKLVSDLLQEYTLQRNEVERAVARYHIKHYADFSIDPGSATSALQQSEAELKRLQSDQIQAHARFQLLKDEFARTRQTVIEQTVKSGIGKDPAFQAAQEAQIAAKAKVDELKLKYTDSNPLVKAAQLRLDAANADLQRFKSMPGANSTARGPIMSQVETVNPYYTALQERVKQAEIDLRGLDAQVVACQQRVVAFTARARKTPDEQYYYRRMQDNLSLYSTFQNEFAVKLETAKMDEKRDKAYKLQEIKQVVQPESEQENKGARGMLILAAGPLLGLVIAFAFSLLAETLDHSLRTPVEVEQFLGKPVLAVLPRIKSPAPGARRQLASSDTARPSLPSTEA